MLRDEIVLVDTFGIDVPKSQANDPNWKRQRIKIRQRMGQSIRCLILIRCHALPHLHKKSHSLILSYAKTRDTTLPVATGNGRFSLSCSSVCGSIPIAANIVAARSPNGTGSRSGYAPFLSLTP